MSTTAAAAPLTVDDQAVAPELQGFSHLGLTVADLDRAVDFWCTVMGFRCVIQAEDLCMVWQPEARLAIGLTTHGGSAVGSFDESRVGLDHLALAVQDLPTLEAWVLRFDELSVQHSSITQTDAGHHLNVRAPDAIAIELFVIGGDFASSVLGVEVGTGSADTHH